MDPTQAAAFSKYLPWLEIAGVFVLFIILRFSRRELRRRVDEIGYRLMREKGLLMWFWLNAPGVMVHELSHALMVLLFYPFGFRITSITLFHIKPQAQRNAGSRVMNRSGRFSLQLGEVQYARPQGKLMSYIGDGFSGIAPLIGGTLMFLLLYWLATGYALWDNVHSAHMHTLPPGWPIWAPIIASYFILTITSELWPSRQDWRGARWLVGGLLILTIFLIALLWYVRVLVFNHTLLLALSSIAFYIDFALIILVALDIVFLVIAEVFVQVLRR